MRQILWGAAFAVHLVSPPSLVRGAPAVRFNNGANCAGVSSCRPRCITFKIDRTSTDCAARTGAFSVTSDINPWDTKGFRTYNCDEDGTCMNDKCGQPLPPGNLTVRIGEEGYTGSYYHAFVDLPEDEDTFTFCSIYPCPKDECALPEQMGYELQIEIVDTSLVDQIELNDTGDGHMFLNPDYFSLGLEIVLKAAFVGEVLSADAPTRFGPLHIEWMDDPTGCRDGYLPYYAPVAPPSDPSVLGVNAFLHMHDSLFCSGEEYEAAPLPVASPAPSNAPTVTPMPTPTPTMSAVHISQVETLREFFDSTDMANPGSRPKHNWFPQGGEPFANYCSFTGLSCDTDGYVIGVQLDRMSLSGSLPSSLLNFKRLQRLKLVGNSIGGHIPSKLSTLKHLVQVELADNDIVGVIPDDLGSMHKVRRLLVQNNDLNGTIPSSLCGLNGSLTAIDLSNNERLEGVIPECFGDMPKLNAIRVDNVGLVGAVPLGLCGVRDMNGLAPNLFGCDSIACPAGTYQPLTGRQTSNETVCMSCGATPSNVIGSRSCLLLEGNDSFTLAPTSSPRPSTGQQTTPTLNPTALPTALSTALPTAFPTAFPTAPPTAFPTADATTEAPTPSATSDFVEFSLQMNSTEDLMENDTISTFASVTKTFISYTMPTVADVKVNVLAASVLSQSLQEPTNETFTVLTTGKSSSGFFRRSLQNTSGVLVVTMRVDGTVSPYKRPPLFSFPDTVLYGFEHNLTFFLESLADASPFFVHLYQAGALNRVVTGTPHNNKAFFGTVIPLIAVCCIVIAIFLIRRQNARKKKFARHTPGPLSEMSSTSSDEDHFASPPPPPPMHSQTIDVHHCASSTCSCCNPSSSSGLYFIPVENENAGNAPRPKIIYQDVGLVPLNGSSNPKASLKRTISTEESVISSHAVYRGQPSVAPPAPYRHEDAPVDGGPISHADANDVTHGDWQAAHELGVEWRQVGGEI